MFHKYKRRRLTRPGLAEKDSAQELSSPSFLEHSELAGVIESFEPVHSELAPGYFEKSSYQEESNNLKITRDEFVREATVSEMPTGERTFYFGCYDPKIRLYKERKLKISRDFYVEKPESLASVDVFAPEQSDSTIAAPHQPPALSEMKAPWDLVRFLRGTP